MGFLQIWSQMYTVFVYVIGRVAVVFGINSSRIVNIKEIVRGELILDTTAIHPIAN